MMLPFLIQALCMCAFMCVCIGAYVYVGTRGFASVFVCLWRQKNNIGFDPPELSPPS